MTKATTKYAPGDRFVYGSFTGVDRPGTIVKASKVSAQVRLDGANKDERVDLDSIRPETAVDREKREHAARMKEWEYSQPPHGVVSIERDRSWYRTNKVTGFAVSARTPAEMRQAADELRLLADWFEQRPVAPSDEDE